MATTPAVVRFAYIDFRVENHDKGDKPAKQQVGESIEGEKQDKRVNWSARCRDASLVSHSVQLRICTSEAII